jgi:hypothetical protein
LHCEMQLLHTLAALYFFAAAGGSSRTHHMQLHAATSPHHCIRIYSTDNILNIIHSQWCITISQRVPHNLYQEILASCTAHYYCQLGRQHNSSICSVEQAASSGRLYCSCTLLLPNLAVVVCK